MNNWRVRVLVASAALAACAIEQANAPPPPPEPSLAMVDAITAQLNTQLILVERGLTTAKGVHRVELNAVRRNLLERIGDVRDGRIGMPDDRLNGSALLGSTIGANDEGPLPVIWRNEAYTYGIPYLDEVRVLTLTTASLPAFISTSTSINIFIDGASGPLMLPPHTSASPLMSFMYGATSQPLTSTFNCTQQSGSMTAWTSHGVAWSAGLFNAPLDTYNSAPRTSHCGDAPWPLATISGASGSLRVGSVFNLTSSCGSSSRWSTSDARLAVVYAQPDGMGLLYGVAPGEVDVRVDCAGLKLYPAGISVTVELPLPPPDECGQAELTAMKASGAAKRLPQLATGSRGTIGGADDVDCGAPGGGEGYVHIHAGIHGVGNLNPALRDWRNPVAKISIRRIP